MANRRNVEDIVSANTLEDIQADSISAEFRTKDNKLSIWEIPDENIDLGVLAIALSSTKIDTMDFLILKKDMLERAGLIVEKSKPSPNPLIQANNMRHDISYLRMRDFARLATVYKEAGLDETHVFRYYKNDLTKKIKQAIYNGWINIDNGSKIIKEILNTFKYSS
ncbi:MAG: hypothetical protein LBJ61_05585 [Deltaproteobacteria bacterium]|nr:hypothetical protein [Deltaproteobacteria bacterium]